MLNILLYIFYFFCLFPYLQLIPLKTDAQPYALILGLFLLPCLVITRNINKDIFCVLLVLIFAFFLLPFSSFDFQTFRSIINYVSLFVISTVTYYALKYQKGLSYSLFKSAVYIWFIVGFIQVAIFRDFLSILRYRGDNELMVSSGRGVVGLAVEPTFYGMVCLLFLSMNYLNFWNNNKFKLITILLTIQILFFARSTTCIFLIVFSLSIYVLLKLLTARSKSLFFLIFLIFASVLYVTFVNMDLLKEYRYGELLSAFMEDPIMFIFIDGSVNERFIQLFFPIHGFFTSCGFPHGFGDFAYYLDDVCKASSYHNFIMFYSHETHQRINSCIGSMLFELGVLSFPFFYMLQKKVVVLRKVNKYTSYFIILFIFIILNNINFNMSLLSFFVGNLIYLSNNITENDKP